MKPITSDPEPTLVETSVGRVAVAREGDVDGPAVLCLHGIPGSVRDFRYLGPRLAGFDVVRVDMPGFGASPLGPEPSVAGWATAAEAVADALELDRFVVTAHSFGVSAALQLAHDRAERVAGLVLLAGPGGRMHRGYGAPHAFFWAAAQLAALPLVRGPWVKYVRAQFDRRGLEIPCDWPRVHNLVRVVASLRFEPLAHWAAAITCPVILGHSEDDPLVEIDIAREQAGRFADCEALFWLEGGHHIQKTHADEIAAATARRFG